MDNCDKCHIIISSELKDWILLLGEGCGFKLFAFYELRIMFAQCV